MNKLQEKVKKLFESNFANFELEEMFEWDIEQRLKILEHCICSLN